jgi:hypothetical protein
VLAVSAADSAYSGEARKFKGGHMNTTESNIEKTTGITEILEVEIEELEAIVAPYISTRPNHNETLIRDAG